MMKRGEYRLVVHFSVLIRLRREYRLVVQLLAPRRQVSLVVRRLAGGARLGGDYGYANVDSYFGGRTWHYHWPRPRGATPEPQAPPCAEQVVRSRACLSHIYRAGDIPLTPGVDAL